MDQELEQFRYALFMGKKMENQPPLTQEEYIQHYEQQWERNPAAERKLLEEMAAPILPTYRKEMEQAAKLEQMMTGQSDVLSFSDAAAFQELYDEISDLETEEEWQQLKNRLLKSKK